MLPLLDVVIILLLADRDPVIQNLEKEDLRGVLGLGQLLDDVVEGGEF